jgi:hypothetical protein
MICATKLNTDYSTRRWLSCLTHSQVGPGTHLRKNSSQQPLGQLLYTIIIDLMCVFTSCHMRLVPCYCHLYGTDH